MVGLQPSALARIVGRGGALSGAPHLELLFDCRRGAEMGRPGAGVLVLAPHTCLSVVAGCLCPCIFRRPGFKAKGGGAVP